MDWDGALVRGLGALFTGVGALLAGWAAMKRERNKGREDERRDARYHEREDEHIELPPGIP
jgi:hypothetical protein